MQCAICDGRNDNDNTGPTFIYRLFTNSYLRACRVTYHLCRNGNVNCCPQAHFRTRRFY